MLAARLVHFRLRPSRSVVATTPDHVYAGQSAGQVLSKYIYIYICDTGQTEHEGMRKYKQKYRYMRRTISVERDTARSGVDLAPMRSCGRVRMNVVLAKILNFSETSGCDGRV